MFFFDQRHLYINSNSNAIPPCLSAYLHMFKRRLNMQPSVMHACYTAMFRRQSSHVLTVLEHAACSVTWFYVCACVCPCVCVCVCVCVCARRHSNDHLLFSVFFFERLITFRTFACFSNVRFVFERSLTWPLTSMFTVFVHVCLLTFNW